MGRPPAVRTATAADVDRVLTLWATARSAAAQTPDSREVLERLLARDAEALLVAELDGRVVGALIAGFDGWRGNMYRLAVAPDHRRQGIGLALVAEGERRLRSVGARRISALVGHEDEVAVAAWEGLGYRLDAATARFVKNV